MMTRMEMDKKWIFENCPARMNFFQIFKFGLEIFDILHKCFHQSAPFGNCFQAKNRHSFPFK